MTARLYAKARYSGRRLTGLFRACVRALRTASCAFAGVAFAALALGATGCASLPEGRSAVDSVTVRGASAVDEGSITDEIGTAPSPKFLGLMRGVVYDYEIFDPFALQRDLSRVERLYRARGYYEAHARAGRVLSTGPSHVRVEIVVEEGTPVVTADTRLQWVGDVPAALQALVLRGATRTLRKGAPFDEDKFKEAETSATKVLTDNGYAFAKVRSDVFIDLVHHRADVVFEIDPGVPCVFGKIAIVGLDPDGPGGKSQEIPEASIRRTLDLVEGAPYSTAALDSATQALLDLEIFSVVQIVPELPDPPPPTNVVPVTIRLELTKLRQVRFGGGFEFDQIKTDVHALVGWEDHNFLGGLRDFTVDLKPGVVLYPTRIDQISTPDRLLPEERLRLQLKQPGFLEARTNGYVRPELNTFPLLVPTQQDKGEPIIGYAELKVATGLDRTFGKLFASVGYNVQVEYPFTYRGDLDPYLRTLVLSYPELIAHLDLRDNRIHPRSGIYLATDVQVAGGLFQGDANDVKVLPEVRTYVPLHRRVVFATRASLGFLFPFNYGDIVENHLADVVTDANRSQRVRDIQTVFFRGLFSGGASSNRGFPLRGIAPHGVVPFLNPSTASQQIAANCNPTPTKQNPTPVIDLETCSTPVGGFTLWELSNEARFAISGPFSTVVFCDMSDVSPRPANLRFDHLHLACGAGARYETPVGPIRLDVGYRIQPLQVLGYANDRAAHAADGTEGVQPTFLGIPLALALGIGEAF
jgi:outer membrane translocation and assembly module TamA